MLRKRARSYLAAPPADLAGFPEVELPTGAVLHRVHSAALGAWFFNATPDWRFNPTSATGLGACYFAERPVAGLLETFKGVSVVAEEDMALKAHFTVALERPVRLADLCAAAAGAFGVNGEIHTTTDYALTQAWASALAQAGFEGVRYLCRSDPEMQLVGYALFGAAGAAPPGAWPAGEDRPFADAILAEAEAYGLQVRPTP